MSDDVTERMLRLFERRLKSNPDVSTTTAEILLTEQRADDFGDDDEILTELVDSFGNDQ